MRAALAEQSPNLPVTVVSAAQPVAKDVKASAIVLPGSLAIDPPESLRTWLRAFNGKRLVVPDSAASDSAVVWTQDAQQAAQWARALAESQEFRPPSTRRTSALMVVAYIFAALFALQLLFVLLLLGITAISGF